MLRPFDWDLIRVHDVWDDDDDGDEEGGDVVAIGGAISFGCE